MLDEYDISQLNPRKNPYAKKTKKTITINVNTATLEYFRNMSEETGVPYQTLMNFYLDDCVKQQKKLQFA